MSENLKKCMKELRLAMSNKSSKKGALEYLANKKCIYKALREISMNVVNRQIPLNKKQISKLNPYTQTIKSLKCGVKKKERRKQLVIQSGGFLPWLLPIIASVLPALING